jgi:hypothetical protein
LLGHATHAAAAEQGVAIDVIMRSGIGLAFLGGVCAGSLALLPLFARAHARWCCVAAAAAALFACVASTRLGAWPRLADAPTASVWIISIQLGLLAGGGLFVLALVLRHAATRTIESRFLAIWVAGTFVFAAFLNWGVLARSFLPLLPAVGIVTARALDAVPFAMTRSGRALTTTLLCFSGMLGILLLQADTQAARAARDSAAELAGPRAANRVWFQGHWGFQHYAEAAGALPMDRNAPQAMPGDVILVPMLNTNVFGVNAQEVEQVGHEVTELRSRLVVLGPRSGAGFWSHTLGPLPFAMNLGDVHETFVFRQVR